MFKKQTLIDRYKLLESERETLQHRIKEVEENMADLDYILRKTHGVKLKEEESAPEPEPIPTQ